MYTGSFNTQGCTLRKEEDPGDLGAWLERGTGIGDERWKYGSWRRKLSVVFQLNVPWNWYYNFICVDENFIVFCWLCFALWPVPSRRRRAPSTTITSAPWKHWRKGESLPSYHRQIEWRAMRILSASFSYFRMSLGWTLWTFGMNTKILTHFRRCMANEMLKTHQKHQVKPSCWGWNHVIIFGTLECDWLPFWELCD